jgi:hypothetical protein
MATLTLVEVCKTILIFIRGCLFFYHGMSMQKSSKDKGDLLCWMGMYSFVGDAIFHFTLANWSTSQEQEWSLCQKMCWSLQEGLIVIGIIVFLVIGVENKGCCTEECTALFVTDIAFLTFFATLLLVNAVPFLRTRSLQDPDAYVILEN